MQFLTAILALVLASPAAALVEAVGGKAYPYPANPLVVSSASISGPLRANDLIAVYGITAATGTITGNAFSVGGSTLVVTGGRVGIGTTNPQYILDVGTGTSATATGGTALRVSNNGPTNISLLNSAVPLEVQILAHSAGFYLGPYTNHPMYFRTNSEDRAVITAGGNVGIGTTNPRTLFEISNGTFNVASSGKVGVGTTAPTATLSIKKSAMPTTYTAGDMYLNIGQGNEALNGLALLGFGYHLVAGDYPPSYFGFLETTIIGSEKGDFVWGTRDATTNVQASERMRLTSAGNVGINTTSPQTQLDVNGAAQLGSEATKSTFTATGFWVPRSMTLAQIQAYTPSASELRGRVDCSNCNYSTAIATGATIMGFQCGETPGTSCAAP